MAYRWNFAPVWENADVLLRGAFGTLRLFAICAVAGLLLGLVIGLARHSPHRLWRWPATVFVEFFRNTPVLVQILWFYFALPILLPVEIGPLAAAALGISLNSAAFTGEIVRAVGGDGEPPHAALLRGLLIPSAVLDASGIDLLELSGNLHLRVIK